MANILDAPTATLEDGTIGRWNVAGGGSTSFFYDLSNSTDFAHSGTHSLEVLFHDAGAAIFDIQTTFPDPASLYPLIPSVLFDYEGWIYTPVGSTLGGKLFGEFQQYDASYGFIGGASDAPQTAEVEGGWAHFQGQIPTDVNAAWGAFVVQCGLNEFFGAGPNTYAVGEKRYFDDFIVQEHVVPPPPPPDPYGWGFGVRMSKVPTL